MSDARKTKAQLVEELEHLRARASETEPGRPKRARVEEALPDCEDHDRIAAAAATDAIISINEKSEMIYANPAAARMFGYAESEMTGRPLTMLMPEALRPLHIKSVKRYLEAGARHIRWEGFEAAGLHRTGRVFPVEMSFGEMAIGGGRVFTGVIRDISKRKHNEEIRLARFHRARQQQSAIVALATHDALVSGDLDRAKRVITEVAVETTEVERASVWLLSEDHRELRCVDLFERTPRRHSEGVVLHADDYPNYFEALKAGRAIDAHDARRDPRTSEFRDGYLAPLGITSMLDAAIRVSGDMVGIVCHEQVGAPRTWTADETTFAGEIADQVAQILVNRERKRAEAALRESEETLRDLFESASDLILCVRPDGCFEYVNRAWRQTLGYSEEELAGLSIFDTIHPDSRRRCMEEFRQVLAGTPHPRIEVTFVARDGRSVIAEGTCNSQVKDGQPVSVRGIFRDITERKRAEEALLEREARMRAILESAVDGIITIDERGVIESINPAIERLFGYREEELLGRSVTVLMPEPWRGEHDAHIAEYLRTGVKRIIGTGREVVCQRKDATTFPGRLSVSEIRLAERRLFTGIIHDITERTRAEAERRKLEAQLLHAQKLESLGLLAGGIAHDFNNLLTGIMGNASLALLELAPESPVRASIAKVEGACARASELCNQLLAYSGKGKFIVKALDLSALVEEMTHMIRVSISKKAVLKLNLEKGLVAFEADATQVRQIVLNLITNASEAIGDRSGVIAISTGAMECDRAYLTEAFLNEDLPEGAYVYLEVSDTGCGMDAETQKSIFDPFFTTKFTGRGLGMAAVLGIVRGHRGAIKVYSELGHGTTFKVLFPACDKPVEAEADQTIVREAPPGAGTILVVDDEETVRTLAKITLEKFGFDVVTAEDGRSALEIFRRRPGGIAAVLLDLTMPHLSGEEVFRELRRVRPDVPVVLSSGYNEQDVTDRFAGKGLAGFLQKPYRAMQLVDKVRDVLRAEADQT